MLERYTTVSGYGRETIEVKKSKFIASVTRAESEEAAVGFIDQIKDEHSDATHNVYAYQIGDHDQIQRYNDDGEPSGTAGVPVLQVIQNMGLKNVVVVVTRYFGGTLLGASGLIRAYGRAAKEGILAAGLVERVRHDEVVITLGYELAGKVQNEILTSGYQLIDSSYTDKVSLAILLPPGERERLQKKINELTSATAVVEYRGQRYVELPR